MKTRSKNYPKYILLLKHNPPLPVPAQGMSRNSLDALLLKKDAAAIPSELDVIIDELTFLSEQTMCSICYIIRDDIIYGELTTVTNRRLDCNGIRGDFFDPMGPASIQLSIVCCFLRKVVFPRLVSCEDDVPDWFKNRAHNSVIPLLPPYPSYCHFLLQTLLSAREQGIEYSPKNPKRPTLYVDLILSTDFMEKLCNHYKDPNTSAVIFPLILKRMYAWMWFNNFIAECSNNGPTSSMNFG